MNYIGIDKIHVKIRVQYSFYIDEKYMIIIGVRGTKLESLFKQFYKQMVAEQEILFQMIEEFTGVAPIKVMDKGVLFRKGYSCQWNYNYIIFPEGSSPLNMVSQKVEGVIYYTFNRSLKSSARFMNIFKGLDGNVLQSLVFLL